MADTKQGIEYIDITPEGLKTPEGAKRVSGALEKFHDANAEVANITTQFLRQCIGRRGRGPVTLTIELGPDDLETLAEVWECIDRREQVQGEFVRAVAGR